MPGVRRCRGLGWKGWAQWWWVSYGRTAVGLMAITLGGHGLTHSVPGASAAASLTAAQRWFARKGVQIQALLIENGSAYLSHLFAAACHTLGIRHHRTRPYSPQTNGKAERLIRTCLSEWADARSYRTSVARASALPNLLRSLVILGIPLVPWG